MRYVGRHRAPRPMYVRHPLVGGVATAVLLGVPALAVAAGTLPQGQPAIPGTQVPVPTSSYGGLSETEPRSVLAAISTSTGPGGSRKSATTTLRTATRTVPDGRVSLLPEPDDSAAGTERARRTSTSTAPTVGPATPTSTTTSTTTTSTISPVPTPTPTPTAQPVAPTPTETPTETPTTTTPPVTPTAEPTPDTTTTSSTSPVSTP